MLSGYNSENAVENIFANADFTEGVASTSNVQNLILAAAADLNNLIAAQEAAGRTVTHNVDFSYENINVTGLEAVHSQGWTGEGVKVLVLDWHDGSSFYEGFNYPGYDGDYLRLAHGVATSSIVTAVTPGATIVKDEASLFGDSLAFDSTMDVVNASFGYDMYVFGNRDYATDVFRTLTDDNYDLMGFNPQNYCFMGRRKKPVAAHNCRRQITICATVQVIDCVSTRSSAG